MINQRFNQIVNLERFSRDNKPLYVGDCRFIIPPHEDQKILRMLVSAPYALEKYCLPKELEWLRTSITLAETFQRDKIGVRHPFVYVTVRHGLVDTYTDNEWHVDGFSTKYNHLPEANYIVVLNGEPTEWLKQRFYFPDDFDPLEHNVHKFFQLRAMVCNIRSLKQRHMYMIDPYIVHRRPPSAVGFRTFVRISFTPIEIPDINNTKNPLIETPHYITDGVRDFRDKLKDYDAA